MAWTTPATVVGGVGHTATAAWANEQVRDNMTYLKGEADKFVPLDVVTADVEAVNTVDKTALWTYTLAANKLGSNNQVEGELWLSLLNNFTNPSTTFTFTLEYGGTAVAAPPAISTLLAATRGIIRVNFTLKGNAATNAQRCLFGMSGINSDGATVVIRSVEGTAAVDSTSNQTLALYVVHGVANAAISSICRSARLNYHAAL